MTRLLLPVLLQLGRNELLLLLQVPQLSLLLSQEILIRHESRVMLLGKVVQIVLLVDVMYLIAILHQVSVSTDSLGVAITRDCCQPRNNGRGNRIMH